VLAALHHGMYNSDELSASQHSSLPMMISRDEMLAGTSVANHLGKPGKVRASIVSEKSGVKRKVGEKLFLHVVNYHEYCSWHKICEKGVLY